MSVCERKREKYRKCGRERDLKTNRKEKKEEINRQYY